MQRKLLSFLVIGLLIGLSTIQAEDDDKNKTEFHDTVKIKDFDLDRNLGTIKVGKELYAFKLSEKTRIRNDSAVKISQRRALESLKIKDVAILAKADRGDYLKPRLILATGYALQPLPKGRGRIPPLIGLLGWYTGEVVDWALPGEVSTDGGSNLAATQNEVVMVCTRTTADKIKKNKTVHFDGKIDGKMKIRISGQLVENGKTLPDNKLREVKIIHLDRVVFMHRAFKKLYRYMWVESFSKSVQQ